MHAHTLCCKCLLGVDCFQGSPLNTCLTFTGGYTLRNVARCWCFETSRMLGLDLPDQLPDSVRLLLCYFCLWLRLGHVIV